MSRILRLLVGSLVLVAPLPASASEWVWPLPGAPVVSRPFAPGGTPYSPGHRGADLVGLPGEPVLAAGAGRVSFAGVLAGRGVLTVTHGSLRTTYEPVAATARVGQLVAAGQPIGTLLAGHAGCPVAACLHWGLRRGTDYLDPVRLVVGGPVRLLPFGRAGTVGVGPGSSSDLLGSRPVSADGGLATAAPGRPDLATAPDPAGHSDASGRRAVELAALGGGVLVLGQSVRRRRG